MKNSLFILWMSLLTWTQLIANDGDTTFVTVHNGVAMTWYGNYDQTGVFPNDAGKTYRKIWLRYTLGCPSSGCSSWDYTTQIFLMKPTGTMDSSVAHIDTISTSPLVTDTTWNVYEVLLPMELARVITPYGGTFSNSWKREFLFDVTDYVDLLKDSVQIRAFYSGWSSGFSATLKFEFIEGTPPRNILGMYNIYKGDATYDTWANFESNFFNAKTVQIPAGIAGARIFSTITGHGFDNNVSCAEFCPRSYDIKVNSTNVANKTVWRDDCGLNPIYPQGGTWLYDRAGWCPGQRAITHEQEVSVAANALVAGSANTIDFDMQNYTWSGNQAPSYTVDAHLVVYGSPNFSNDAYLLDVINPSKNIEYSRQNPFCGKPIVKVQNTGANTLTSITFEYGLQGAGTCSYTWTGNLAFLETTNIELPNVQWSGANFSAPVFHATIVGVNNGADDYNSNNSFTSSFSLPDVYNIDSIYIELITNNYGTETGYQLLDANGTLVHERVATSLAANTNYTDILQLAEGCYTLKVLDSGKDGLSFWADAAAGTGSLKLKKYLPAIHNTVDLRNFGTDFGTSIYYPFIIGANNQSISSNVTAGCFLASTPQTVSNQWTSTIYPNPTSGLCNVLVSFAAPQTVQVRVLNALGQTVLHKEFNNVQNESLPLQLPNNQAGIYFVQLQTSLGHWTHTVSVQP